MNSYFRGNGTIISVSRNKCQNSFCSVNENRISNTVERCLFNTKNKIIIICNKEHEHIVKNQVKDLNLTKYIIIVEPEGRDTAAAICISSFQDESSTLVVPCDHIFENNKFVETLNKIQADDN